MKLLLTERDIGSFIKEHYNGKGFNTDSAEITFATRRRGKGVEITIDFDPDDEDDDDGELETVIAVDNDVPIPAGTNSDDAAESLLNQTMSEPVTGTAGINFDN